jgi:hypothetical protein
MVSPFFDYILQYTVCVNPGKGILMANLKSTHRLRTLGIVLFSFAFLMVGLKLLVTSAMSFGADFSIYWQAGRAIVLRGISPYAESTTQLIQQGIYGRLAHAGEDQVRYAYPPYSLLVIFPSAFFPYPWAQAYWMAFNLVLLFLAVLSQNKRPPVWMIGTLVFFYPVSRGVILGQFALILGSSLLLIHMLLNRESPSKGALWGAGILMAWAAMKPHLTGLILLFYFLDSIHKRRWSVLYGLAAGIVLFAGISWLLVPTWVTDWIHLIRDYVGYVPNQPILGSWLALLGIDFSALWLKLGLGIVALGLTVWVLIGWWRGKLPDFLALGWLILEVQLVNPNPNSLLSDQIVFLLPLLVWNMQSLEKTWVKGIWWAAFVIVPWTLFAIYLQGKEPYQAAAGLAFVFALWFIDRLIRHLAFRNTGLQKITMVEGEQA